MSFRKEKKFKLSISESRSLRGSLLNKGMDILHPKRIIKSCYFDTKNLKMYHDSEEGILPRKKIRFRWYNDQTNVSKEIKISSIEGRYKTITPVKSIQLEYLEDYNLCDSDYGLIQPYLLVTYEREYFSYKNLRLTFDTNISYDSIRPFFRFNKDF